MLSLGVVVVGVTDRERAQAFWSAALDYDVRTDGFGGWEVVLEPRTGQAGARVALQRSVSRVEAQPRLHLDLHVANRAELDDEVTRLVALGASRVDWPDYPDDPDFVVLADTEDNVFCIVNLGHPD